MAFGCCTVPCHFHLETTVAQVASHGCGIDEFLQTSDMGTDFGKGLVAFFCLQVGNLAIGTITEDDKLDAMESEQLLSQLSSCVCNAVFTLKFGHLVGVLQCGGQSVGIQGPCVDVRIDTEVGGGTIEECLALLPLFAGLKEYLADVVDITLINTCRVGLEPCCHIGQTAVQAVGGIGNRSVCLVNGVGDILRGNGFHPLFIHCEVIALTLVLMVITT